MKTPQFDFVGRLRRWLIISGVLLAICVGALAIRGLDLSMDFVGGSSYQLEGVRPDLNAQELREAAEQAGANEATAQLQTEGEQVIGAIVRTESLDPGSSVEQDVRAAVAEVSEAEEVAFEFVGPVWGERITRQAIEALLVFLVIITIYITVRLEFKMAIAAIVATVHDVVVTIGIYALVGFPVSPATVIALLTILGYSLYDTVIVFDRVKDNRTSLGEPGFRTYGELVNTSMNQVLYRSLSTSITSLLPVGALLVIGSQLLGATTLQDLALALFVGMAVGIYSSLFIAGPLYARLKSNEPLPRAVLAVAPRSARGAKDARTKATGAKATGAKDAGRATQVESPDGDAEVEDAPPAPAPPDEPAAPAAGSAESRRPITTEYVRGQGKGKKRRKR